jgi:hypothetical protein
VLNEYQAADIYLIHPMRFPQGIVLDGFMIQRHVNVSRERNLVFACGYAVLAETVRAKGYTIDKNPGLTQYCIPYFNSLKLD